MRLTAKLLQQLDSKADKTQPKWKEVEFDYEHELTVRIYATSRVPSKRIIQFRAEESSDEIEYVKQIDLRVYKCKRENATQLIAALHSQKRDPRSKAEQKLYNSLSDLVSTYGSASSALIDLITSDSSTSSTTSDHILKDSSKTLHESLVKNSTSSARTDPNSVSHPYTSNFIRYRSHLATNSPNKSLPRLLCRNRSFNDASTSSTWVMPKIKIIY